MKKREILTDKKDFHKRKRFSQTKKVQQGFYEKEEILTDKKNFHKKKRFSQIKKVQKDFHKKNRFSQVITSKNKCVQINSR